MLNNDELKSFWGAGYFERFPFGPFVLILMLTGQRCGEVSGMRWDEINLDERTWVTATERGKNGHEHTVPLSSLTTDILQSVPKSLNSGFVFTTNGRNSISGFGRLKKCVDKALPEHTDDWRFHDLRPTAVTGMGKMGALLHVIEVAINHKLDIVPGVAATYNRDAYIEEKRVALERWSCFLNDLLKERHQ